MLLFPPPMNVAVNELPKELGSFYTRVLKGGNLTGTGVSFFRGQMEEQGFGTYTLVLDIRNILLT